MSSDSEEYSDEDYQPEKDMQDAGSEIETDDDIDDDEEPEVPQSTTAGAQKRKSLQPGASPRKRCKTAESGEPAIEQTAKKEDDEAAEKERANALWADFLGDAAGDSTKEEERPVEKRISAAKQVKAIEKVVEEKKQPEPVIIKEIFEFAGEEVVVEKKVTVTDVARTSSSTKSLIPAGRASGGLGSVLGALNKKNKISTLEKTKLDWNRFKDQEGITEDLNTHNRGKEGYLERQDFLERTDVRQFEIEKSLRQTRRSNR